MYAHSKIILFCRTQDLLKSLNFSPFYEPYPDSFLHCGNVFLFNMFCFLPFLSIGKLKRMLHYSDLLSFCLAETFFVQHVKTQRKIRLDFPLRKIQHDLSLGFGVLFFTFSFYRKIEHNLPQLYYICVKRY